MYIYYHHHIEFIIFYIKGSKSSLCVYVNVMRCELLKYERHSCMGEKGTCNYR